MPKLVNNFLVIMMLSLLLACGRQEQVRQIPVRDFFKTPEKSTFKISPDGKYVSYLKPYKDKRNLFVQSLADGREMMATSFTDYGVHEYSWTYNNKILLSRDMIDIDQFNLYTLDMETRKLNKLLTENKKVRLRILNRIRKQPSVVNVVMNKRDPATFDVYRLNINTGQLQLYIKNPGNITEWFPDDNGIIRLAKASDGVEKRILYRSSEAGPFRVIIKTDFKTSVDPVAFTGKGNNFYALSNVNRDKTALVQINADNGREDSVIYESAKADISEVGYSRNKHRIEYAGWEDDKPHRFYLNADAEEVYTAIKKQLQSGVIKFVERDSAENKFIIDTYTDRDPGTYYLYERNSNKLTRLGNLNTNIKPNELCEMKPVSFKAKDGLLINGYLTLPQGGVKTGLPVVIMPHNGPWSRNTWGYSAEVQFLANRGYAVFQVNYRGSTGYGKDFYSAGFKQVGGKIQSDITDGVKWLINQKIANPRQIAIFGGGFGGFSALYGVSFHPGLYRCAVVQYGLINFFTYIKDAPPFFKPYLQMTYEMVGNPETDASQLRAISPVFHADKIKAPLLIFQGAKDSRANISELNQYVRELQKRKVKVKYILKPNERTYFRSEHNRTEMYTEIEKFLEDNLKAKP